MLGYTSKLHTSSPSDQYGDTVMKWFPLTWKNEIRLAFGLFGSLAADFLSKIYFEIYLASNHSIYIIQTPLTGLHHTCRTVYSTVISESAQ